MTRLRQRLLEELQRRNYAPDTGYPGTASDTSARAALAQSAEVYLYPWKHLGLFARRVRAVTSGLTECTDARPGANTGSAAENPSAGRVLWVSLQRHRMPIFSFSLPL